MIAAAVSALADHLWQSTVCVGAAWLLTLALRRNRAAVRYGLWLAASVKFLLPFSLLVSIGAQLPWRLRSANARPELAGLWNEIGRPFGAAAGLSSTQIAHTAATNLPMILVGIWAFGLAAGLIFWIRWMREMSAVRRAATPLDFDLPILVWWIRIQLVLERERACDEEVLRGSRNPQVYAEAILNVCKLYTEAPLVCVSGVTGAGLKRRIEAILASRTGTDLNPMKKLLLASAAIAAVIGPIAIAIGHAPAVLAQSRTGSAAGPRFEVASVRMVNHPVPVHPYRLDINHGTLKVDAVPLQFIISLAYPGQRLEGGPGWIEDERYDIEAKKGNPNSTRDEVRVMLQNSLADRFKLAFHTETGKCVYTRCSWERMDRSSKKPRLTGTYDFTLEWPQDPSDSSGPSIFTAVEEQLGLKLEAGKGPVEVMAIDHVEHATPN